MVQRGTFRMISSNDNKYLWQYEKQKTSIYHVIRPLEIKNSINNYWEFATESRKNIHIDLHNGDSIDIEDIQEENDYLHITVTWNITTNILWDTVKDSQVGKLINLANNKNINSILENNDFDSIDSTLDEAVLFFQKITNNIQILQDKLSESKYKNNLKEILPKNKVIKRTVVYTSKLEYF
tara:strand:- start:8905 stop:9447 length:543 start_codon:yes stop_codon:yes gene_type:complete